jgi:O-antigen ligase
MEFLQEGIASRELWVWLVLLVALVLLVKVLASVGKGIVMILIVVAIGLVLVRTFPDLFDPVVEFIEGGWMRDGS